MENSIMEGRLLESRVSEQSARIEQRVIRNKCSMEELKSEAGTPPKPSPRTNKTKSTDAGPVSVLVWSGPEWEPNARVER